MDQREAADALRSMHAAQVRLAGRARWSAWRHAAFGVIMGGLIASYALPGPWAVVGVALCLLGTALIVRRDRQRDGFFVSGYRAGATRRLTIVLLVVTFAALAAAVVLRDRYGIAWAPVALGAVVALVAARASLAWERLYREELGRGGD